MTTLIQFFGLAMITFALLCFYKSMHKTKAGFIRTLLVVIILVGAALLFHHRITEMKVTGIATIRAATEQAVTGADEIANLKTLAQKSSAQVFALAVQTSNNAFMIEAQILQLSNDVVIAKDGLNYLTDLNQQMELHQQLLAMDLAHARQELDIQKTFLLGKAGSITDYMNLQSLSRNESGSNSIAPLLFSELQGLYREYNNRPDDYFLAEVVTMKRMVLPIDELVVMAESANPLRSSREAFFDQLAHSKKTNTVEHLCHALSIETNAFVACRIIRALEATVSTNFGVLNIQGVANWWKEHKSQKEFASPYKPFILMYREGIVLGGPVADRQLQDLNSLIEAEPNALLARCCRGAHLSARGEFDKAQSDFAEVRKQLKNYCR
jgi:hypothetical protein